MHDSAEDQRLGGYDVQAGGAFKKHRAGGRSRAERSAGTDVVFLQKPPPEIFDSTVNLPHGK